MLSLGKQPAGAAEVVQQIRIARTIHQRSAEVCHRRFVPSGFDLRNAQRCQCVHAVKVRNGLLRVTLGQQSVAQLQMRSVELRA